MEQIQDFTNITNQVDNIHHKVEDFLHDEHKARNKITYLETEINNIRNFIARPESDFNIDMLGEKDAFSNYIRKGNVENLTTKSFSNSNEEGDVLLLPSLYNKIISEINARSPIRQLASSDTISTNALDVVLGDGRFASGWVNDTDAREVTDTPKLKSQRIFVHELYAQPKASQVLIDDAAIQIESWLAEKLRDSFLRAENEAFINGNGEKKPYGILNIEHNQIETLDAGNEITTETLLDMINAIDEEYAANSSFLMHRSTLSEIQKLKDQNGRFIWQPSLSDSLAQTIFGIPVLCSSNMPTIADGALAIAFGDFKAAYKIVDRKGINLMRDPYTEKPFVKFYATKRVGGDVINKDAIRLAKFSG